jgi:hypothetical protein
MAENFNRQLQRRLKTIEAFQSFSTALNYLNMLRNYLRFKPFTDCKRAKKNRNGFAPIELCKAKLLSRDWIKNSINLPKLPTANCYAYSPFFCRGENGIDLDIFKDLR